MRPTSALARVAAPARLHLGFLDPAAALGRRFGSIGLGIEGLDTVVTATPAETLQAAGPQCRRTQAFAERVLAHYDLPNAVSVSVEAMPPPHAGLGSGTQLALAVASAVLGAFGRHAPAAELACLLGRGRRSGIGLSLFDQGGLVVDGGHGPATQVPPVVSRLPFPEEWHAVLVLDAQVEGLSGRAEHEAFGSLAPMPQSTAAHLCHVTLMGLLPAVAEHDFGAFCRCVTEVQGIVGDYFASAQAGRFTSTRVGEALAYGSDALGLGGIGQSSWGPTGFAFADNRAAAAAACRAFERHFGHADGLRFRVCKPCNHGAVRQSDAQSARRRTG